ncbi:MAG: CRISPR-associated endonuclease Cas2 [Candidatus Caenarcaniphilales bacterium]|nr:CRISPR-associated endonuclease Cas2 [Candidatus Caenarcaniphilales bacterium]
MILEEKEPAYLKDPPVNWLIGAGDREPNEIQQEEEEILVKVGQRKYFIILCYDITEPKRLAKVAKACLGFGERVQKSVYECHLTKIQINKMISKLVPLIDQETDGLRIYRIAGDPQVLTWGKVPVTTDEDVIIV